MAAPFCTARLPRFVVITIRVFAKEMVRPFESVNRPSSSSCSIMLKTSGWAFSTSSKSTKE